MKWSDAVIEHLSFFGPDGSQELFMTNLQILSEDITIKYLYAPDMNIVLQGQNVVVSAGGTLHGNNITIIAEDSDNNIGQVINAVTGSVGLETDVALGLGEAVVTPDVAIEQGAVITAGGSVIIRLDATLNQPLLGLSAISPVTIKVASTDVTIDGTINAGGSVNVSSVHTIVQDSSNLVLSAAFIPLAVVTVFTFNEVTVGNTGTVNAGGSVNLSANTNITSTNRATVGGLPISLAVSLICADVDVVVEGAVSSDTGDITLDAGANTNVKVYSSEKAPVTQAQQNPEFNFAIPVSFGGFFAIAIVF